MSYGRYKAAAVVLDGKLYVAGGYNTNTHQFMDSVEVFDDVSQQWYSVSPLLKVKSNFLGLIVLILNQIGQKFNNLIKSFNLFELKT